LKKPVMEVEVFERVMEPGASLQLDADICTWLLVQDLGSLAIDTGFVNQMSASY
jgi:hypothetical protein